MEERMDFRILNNGSFVPSIGFGTYKTGTSEETEQAVTNALQAGYRLLDTAAYYDNEEAVGKGMSASGINRSDIIVTTKIWHTNAGYDATMRAVESSLKKLNTNYIDIMLIHQPLGDYYGSWRAMEELYDQNVLRGLGLSNFYEDRLIDLLYHCNVKPVVNQIECHPFNQRQSFIPLPKATSLEHMKSNFDVFDFKLSITDMDLMELLDQRAFLENHHTAAGLERILKLK